eukprot:g46411.t1
MPRMLDTDSDTDNEVGVDHLVPDSLSLASTQVGNDYDEFRRPRYILSPVTTVAHAVLHDVDGLALDLVSLATTQVGNIDDYDEFRRPRDPVLPATTVVCVVPDPLPCIRFGSGSVVVNDITYHDNRRINHRHNARLRLEYLLYHELTHENYRERPWRDIVPIIICYDVEAVEETGWDPVQKCSSEAKALEQMRALQMVLERKRQLWRAVANIDFTPFLSIVSRFLYQQDKETKKRCDVATPAETLAAEISEDSDASELAREAPFPEESEEDPLQGKWPECEDRELWRRWAEYFRPNVVVLPPPGGYAAPGEEEPFGLEEQDEKTVVLDHNWGIPEEIPSTCA